MKEMLPLEAVTERDIDLLLLEEATVSEEFRELLFTKALGSTTTKISDAKIWHSVSDAELGESDLILRAKLEIGSVVALLIENKIDAPPQPEQAARYASRGQMGIRDREWESFRSLIVAPQKYLETDKEANRYDAKMSYEDICKWFSVVNAESKRAAFKINMLRQAIDQNRRGYNPKIDEEITRFFHEYWLLSQRHFPELNAEDPGPRTSTSSWISFRPTGISGNRKIWHKIEYGEVDLELPFPATDVERITEKYQSLLPVDVKIVKRGKSLGLRIKVSRLERLQPLSEQEREALTAMRAALRLSSLMNIMNGV